MQQKIFIALCGQGGWALFHGKVKKMSILNWFSKKPKQPAVVRRGQTKLDERARELAAQVGPVLRPNSESVSPSAIRKARRQARREQLYTAVREGMTRYGVLASSYKFKVLSLDQAGNQFLVMVDVQSTLALRPEKLADIETMVSLTAKARFEIDVTAVYWRTDIHLVAPDANPSGNHAGRAVPTTIAAATTSTPKPLAARRNEPIQDNEVAALKLANASVAASHPSTSDATGKTRSGPPSYALLTGFEDTEMSESTAHPALSTTQYGDLK